VEADITDGEGVRFSFKTDSAGNTGALVLDVGEWGEEIFRRWSIMYYSGEIYLEVWKVSTRINQQTLMDLSANTWYEVILGIDGTNAFRVLIFDGTFGRVGGIQPVHAGFADGLGGQVVEVPDRRL